MKLSLVPVLVLAFALVSCGGVRERIRAEGGSHTDAFDSRELVDVLPPGRIPSISRPRFESVAKAGEWLTGNEPVVVVDVGADARAYPLAILVWHEVVDDSVGGVPVAVTYAPLCNAAVVFDRRLAGATESFASSGKLYRSDLVMVDRRSTSLWTQLDGRAVAGPAKGATLAQVPSQIASLDEFSSAYPNGAVLARPEGSGRAYGFDPYAGYDSRTQPFGGFFALPPDHRMPSMERVVGIAGDARTYAYSSLRSRRVIEDRLDGRDIVVLWSSGVRSALDDVRMSRGRDVGQTGVFYSVAGSRRLHLSASETGFTDTETGSTWDVLGVATAGPLRGRRLEPVAHVDAFWFAWAAFNPAAIP